EGAADWDEDWDKLEDKGLRDKKCVPCNLKELRPMTEDAAHILMPQTFTKGLEFFKIVADLAESE
ncbi:hypothetical protein HN51_001131, partial [Arachis hypogaea]